MQLQLHRSPAWIAKPEMVGDGRTHVVALRVEFPQHGPKARGLVLSRHSAGMGGENPEVEAGLFLRLRVPRRNRKPDVAADGIRRGDAGGILVEERIVERDGQIGPLRDTGRVRRDLPRRGQAGLQRFRADRKPQDRLRGDGQVEQVLDHARVSRIIVTGPWFAMSTTIVARN